MRSPRKALRFGSFRCHVPVCLIGRTSPTALRYCLAVFHALRWKPGSRTAGENMLAPLTTPRPRSSASTLLVNRHLQGCCSNISDSRSKMSWRLSGVYSRSENPPIETAMTEIVIRPATPADAAAIAQVRIDSWRTTYKGMIPDAYLAAMKIDESAALWEKILTAGPNATSVFVAAGANGIVGFAAGNMLAEPKYGLNAELSAVYLVHAAQRAGIGQRLVATVAAAQRAHGAEGLIAWVIAGNKAARAFYEKLGAELLIEQEFTWDGMELTRGRLWLAQPRRTRGVGQPAGRAALILSIFSESTDDYQSCHQRIRPNWPQRTSRPLRRGQEARYRDCRDQRPRQPGDQCAPDALRHRSRQVSRQGCGRRRRDGRQR